MEIDKFSKSWKVRFLNTDDVDAVVSLCSGISFTINIARLLSAASSF